MSKKSLLDRIKPIVDAVKAAKTLYTIIAILLSYVVPSLYDRAMDEPVIEEVAVVEIVPVEQKDWQPAIDKDMKEFEIRIDKKIAAERKAGFVHHSKRLHGGS